MRRFILALAAFVALTPLSGFAQSAQDLRAERIASNLRLQIEQLREATLQVTGLARADVAGLDRGTLIINGQQRVPFLVTADDTRLYLLAAEAVDVSMTAEELEDEYARLAAEEVASARQRHTELMAASASAPGLGPADAPVTVVEFSDFQCPYCARAVPTVKELLALYPEEVRLVFMHLPLNIHDWAEPAAVAGACVAAQSETAFWALHDWYFANQSGIDASNMQSRTREFVRGQGIDMIRWDDCATDPSSQAYRQTLSGVQTSSRMAARYGANGTPAFFINGRFLSGAQPLSDFTELVEAALREDG